MPKESTVKARVIEADKDITIGVDFLANDSYKEGSQIKLDKDGNWVVLQNKILKSDSTTIYEDSVPYFRTVVLSKEKTNLEQTFKVELEYDNSVDKLDYYHYKDDEEEYFSNWKKSKNSYSVVENEVLSIVVPYEDIDKMVNHKHYNNGFKTLDDFFEYYQKVVDKMDEYMGLYLNPEELTDQNVRTKYLVKANIHGAGAAYYSGNHVGTNSSSVSAFFQMNWGGLHEIAHGYQGSFGKGEMGLGEVSNNILGHYIQTDKSIYYYSGDWLGTLKNIEDDKNKDRLEGTKVNDIEATRGVTVKLYLIVNLLDHFEGAKTYKKMFQWYRKQLNNGLIKDKNKNQDNYSLAIADIYKVNIIPYLEAWGYTVSDNVKEEIYSKNYKTLNILKDMTTNETLNKIMKAENLELKYGLVDNTIYQKYDVKGNLELSIDIDNIEKLKGKNIVIKDADKVVKTVEIKSNKVNINDLAAGSYYLQMPILNEYDQSSAIVSIIENTNNKYTYKYKKLENTDYNNYLSFYLQGYYNTYGYKLTFSDRYRKAKIEFGQAGFTNIKNAAVKIYDKTGKLVSEEIKGYDNKGNFVDNGLYFNFNKKSYEIDIEPGYTIEITHSNYKNKVKWENTLSKKEVVEYIPTGETTRYTVIENGIIMDGMNEKEAENLSYNTLKEYIIGIIEEYKSRVTDEELNNKLINFKEKAKIINAYNTLNINDQIPYEELITKVKQGGKPFITFTNTTEYKKGTDVDLYSLIKVIDNEDGVINCNKDNTIIETNIDINNVGSYDITYYVTDSDLNTTVYKANIKIIANNQTGGSTNQNNNNQTGGGTNQNNNNQTGGNTNQNNNNQNSGSTNQNNNNQSGSSINQNNSTEKSSTTNQKIENTKVPNTFATTSVYIYIIGFIILSLGISMITFALTKSKI